MEGSQLRDLIGQKRPRYKEKYRDLMDAISNKGDATGLGGFSSLGPFYQTYMYAFFIGFKLGKQDFIQPNEKFKEFFVFSQWNPIAIRDYIVMILFNKTEDYGFKWIDLEDANVEVIDTFVAEFIHQLEGYANAGLKYLQNKWENENMKFRNPFIFANILEEINKQTANT